MPTADNRIRLHELLPTILDRLPVILADVGELLAEQQPDYAGFLTEQFQEVLAEGNGFIAQLVDPAQREPTTMDRQSSVYQTLFEEIGRIHCQQQRDVTPLLAAYRTGATVTWRHIADTALQLGVPIEALAGLGAAVFAAVEDLSSASLQGYLQAQSTAGHARERLRDELAELLLSDRSATTTVAAAPITRSGFPSVAPANPSSRKQGRSRFAHLSMMARRRRRPGNIEPGRSFGVCA
ncbi:MAG: hypothetical protein ACRDRO_23995 [Pseudonocardiaceae bacterium]